MRSKVKQRMKAHALNWDDALLDIASNLLLGFSLEDGVDITPVLLTDIQSTLGQIQDSLTELNSKVDSIITALQDLPSEITGIVNKAFATQALANATTRSDR